ncbi:THAP domain-containing protein 4 [Perca flavescens]|uniref:THAP domain-containing protein 4 n=1 Tax=Perca flavescens TaxID=8167 RepID=UPI00106E7D9A|nr:THAP domain-containing protein 4-like [Perca flavescens]
MSCSAFGCKQRQYQGCSINFFRFPLRDRRRLKQWVMNVRRQNWTPTPASRLCSMHFEEDQFLIDNMFRRRLKDTAVPTIFNFPPHLRKKDPPPRPTLNSSTGGVNNPLVSPADHYIVVMKQEPAEETNVDVKQEPAEGTNFVEYGDIVRITVGEVITDDMSEYTTNGDLKTVMHDHIYFGQEEEDISLSSEHIYVSEPPTTLGHKANIEQSAVAVSEAPPTLTSQANVLRGRLVLAVSESHTTLPSQENVFHGQLVLAVSESPTSLTSQANAAHNQPVVAVSESPTTLAHKASAEHDHLSLALSDSPAKLKHQVRVLHEKLVVARKKFKLKCQQTRRMQSKLVSLKEETKALQTKLDDAEKQMAALSQQSNNGGKRRKAKALPKEAKHPLKQQLLPTALIEITFPAPTSTQQDLK